jgi:hypothetical protein
MTGFDALQDALFAAFEFVPDSGRGGLRDDQCAYRLACADSRTGLRYVVARRVAETGVAEGAGDDKTARREQHALAGF